MVTGFAFSSGKVEAPFDEVLGAGVGGAVDSEVAAGVTAGDASGEAVATELADEGTGAGATLLSLANGGGCAGYVDCAIEKGAMSSTIVATSMGVFII
jgi:hypothetical protein